MNTIVCYAVILEERDNEPPYGSGNLLNREVLLACRSHARAVDELKAQKKRWQEYSRFRVILHTERVSAELAERVPA